MQLSTPVHLVSGTIFEAVHIWRPHPKLRPISAPMAVPTPGAYLRYPTMPDTDRCSIPSEATIVDQSESPHLHTSRRQYEVANSGVLGSLGRLETSITPNHSSISPTSNSMPPKSLVGCAKQLLSPRSSRNFTTSKAPETPEDEKAHGFFCRTKSVITSLRSGSKGGLLEKGSRDSLRSGYHSFLSEWPSDEFDEGTEFSETSIISDEPPQIAPLRPMSKFMPDLKIVVPENDVAGQFNIEHNSIEISEEADDQQSSDNSLSATRLRPRSSNVTSVLKYQGTTAETSSYTADETTSSYTSAAEEDGAVFTSSNEMSHNQLPMTSFMVKLQDAVDPNRQYKALSIAPTTGHTDSPLPTPKLRHTASNSTRGMQSGSLQAQFSRHTTPVSSDIPKMWQLNRNESPRELRVAPSLENGLHADTLEVFEEDAMAEAAAIVHIEPKVVDIGRPQTLERSDSPGRERHQSDRNMEIAPLNIASKARRVRSSSGLGPDHDVSTMPIEILHTIVFSAAYGDAKCSELASSLYKGLTRSDSSVADYEWDGRKQRLLLQSQLLEELKIMAQSGFMRDDVFAVIRGQFFPTATTQILTKKDFTNHISRAVSGHNLAGERAEEILRLAFDDEDQKFVQTSPEDEVFFEREPFNLQGFVHDENSSDEHYERLGSLPSTVGTFEEWEQLPEPESEPRWNWRSPFLLKVTRMLRIGYRKPME